MGPAKIERLCTGKAPMLGGDNTMHSEHINPTVWMSERNNSRVSLKTDIRERKYNSESEELQERVCYFIYCLRDSLGLV